MQTSVLLHAPKVSPIKQKQPKQLKDKTAHPPSESQAAESVFTFGNNGSESRDDSVKTTLTKTSNKKQAVQ